MTSHATGTNNMIFYETDNWLYVFMFTFYIILFFVNFRSFCTIKHKVTI